MRAWRREQHGLRLRRGEKVLAWGRAADGSVVAGTRDALLWAEPPAGRPAEDEPLRLPWEQVEAADWDRDTEVLRVSEVGTWGAARPAHTWTFSEHPDRLLALVRERVTASVVAQRHVAVTGRRGLRVIARRAPSGRGEVVWVYEFDEGVDPDDPGVRDAARRGLDEAREQLGWL